jgi:prolyl 4-hydroxylase
MPKRQLDDEWIAWIRHNLARGCSKDELFRILVREGFDLNAIHAQLHGAPKAALLPGLRRHESPLAELYTVEDFLDPRACAALVELIKAGLRPSTISTDDPDLAFRTSRTCDLDESDPVVNELNRRICAAMDTSPSYAEPTQGQYYEVSQEFKAHTDYFEAYELERFSSATWGQRTWTFMVYLNEPERGGETHFVRIGLRVRPKAGLAVIWNNLLPEGRPNPNTLHQGMPVISGNKAIITKWFRRPRT